MENQINNWESEEQKELCGHKAMGLEKTYRVVAGEHITLQPKIRDHQPPEKEPIGLHPVENRDRISKTILPT